MSLLAHIQWLKAVVLKLWGRLLKRRELYAFFLFLEELWLSDTGAWACACPGGRDKGSFATWAWALLPPHPLTARQPKFGISFFHPIPQLEAVRLWPSAPEWKQQ